MPVLLCSFLLSSACYFHSISERTAVAGLFNVFSTTNLKTTNNVFSFFFSNDSSYTHSSVYIQTLLKRIVLFFFRRHFLNLSCIARSIIDACIFRIYLFINFIWMCMRGMTANAFTHRIWYAQNLCVSNEYKRIYMEFIFIWHWTVFMFERGKKTPNRFELTGDVYYYIFFAYM